jgi:hypothetical protein
VHDFYVLATAFCTRKSIALILSGKDTILTNNSDYAGSMRKKLGRPLQSLQNRIPVPRAGPRGVGGRSWRLGSRLLGLALASRVEFLRARDVKQNCHRFDCLKTL